MTQTKQEQWDALMHSAVAEEAAAEYELLHPEASPEAAALAARHEAQRAENERRIAEAAQQARDLKVAEIRARVRDDFPGLSPARRKQINDAVFASPEKNFVFIGRGGLGKTYLADAIASTAQLYEYKVYRTNGTAWSTELRRNAVADFGERRVLELSAESLLHQDPAVIVFDEITRLPQTAFVIDAFQELLGALKYAGHQLIGVSNKTSRKELNEALGESLAWRLFRKDEGRSGGLGCVLVNFAEVN